MSPAPPSRRVRSGPGAALLALAALAPAGCDGSPAPSCADCNVILVSIDTLRADHLGCYGYGPPTSPGIDALAADAVRFETAVAHAPSTLPSHASMFTSLIPPHHGAQRATHRPIAPDVPTLPEILRAAGWRTMSWNGGGQVAAEFGFDRGFELYDSTLLKEPFEAVVDTALEWVGGHREEKFFLFLHTYEVHNPYDPAPDLLELFDAGYDGPLPPAIPPALLNRINDGELQIDDADLRHIVATYDAEIRSVDAALGRLVAGLRQAGLYGRTVLVFTSDHGEEFGEHGFVGRHTHTLYDELLHVPLLLKLPRSALAGTAVAEQVRLIDLLPTLLDLLEIEHAGPFEGRSLLPLLRGGPDASRPAVAAIDTRDGEPPLALREPGRKLILAPPVLDDPLAGERWFSDTARIVWGAPRLSLALAAPDAGRRVEILVDGERADEVELAPEPRSVALRLPAAGGTVTVRSTAPCVPADRAGRDTGGVACVAFRVLNPFEYYRLDRDPAERHNLYSDPAEAGAVAALRERLAAELAAGRRRAPDAIDIDPATGERLRALGYVD